MTRRPASSLFIPSARGKGGFRLCTGADVERLVAIRRMKPPDSSPEEVRDLLEVTDRLAAADGPPAGDEKERLRERLASCREAAGARCETLRARVAAAEGFAAILRRRLGPANRRQCGGCAAGRLRPCSAFCRRGRLAVRPAGAPQAWAARSGVSRAPGKARSKELACQRSGNSASTALSRTRVSASPVTSREPFRAAAPAASVPRARW